MLEFIFEGFIYLIFELFGNIAVSIFIPKDKVQLHIDELKNESWFKELDNDHRFNYIINFNKKVRKLLAQKRYVNYLKTNEKIRERFIDIVKEEHYKFTGVKA